MLVWDVDDGSFDRLVGLAADLAEDDLGPTHLELVPLPAHVLDQHGKLELAATRHLDHVW